MTFSLYDKKCCNSKLEMQMRYAGTLGLLVALTMLTPTVNAQAPAAPSETQEVQQLANRWTEAYNRRNATALGALYTEDARLYLHGSPTVSGRHNIQTYWADDMKEQNPITVLTVTHAVNGIDMKLVHGNYQVINRETGVPVGQGRFAHIWTRTNGEWRLDRDLWNQPYEQ
jgi:uncharacterized protein (TIGR02246 family)